MRHKVTLLPAKASALKSPRRTRRILDAAGVEIDWEEIDARGRWSTRRRRRERLEQPPQSIPCAAIVWR